MCHSPVLFIHRSRKYHWRCTGRTRTVLQIQQSACKPGLDTSYCISSEEQRGESITKSGMEQDKTGEYHTPEEPRCYSCSHARLQGAHTQYKDEGGHPQQSTKKVVQFEMGSKRKYHKNNSIVIMLFCG